LGRLDVDVAWTLGILVVACCAVGTTATSLVVLGGPSTETLVAVGDVAAAVFVGAHSTVMLVTLGDVAAAVDRHSTATSFTVGAVAAAVVVGGCSKATWVTMGSVAAVTGAAMMDDDNGKC
jgi:hypothetical protein